MAADTASGSCSGGPAVMEKTSAYVLAKNTMISLNKARTREGVREVSAAEGSRGASEPYSSVC